MNSRPVNLLCIDSLRVQGQLQRTLKSYKPLEDDSVKRTGTATENLKAGPDPILDSGKEKPHAVRFYSSGH
ncbi:hypothetical protein DNK57_08175 [Methanothermobacter thermautotrophicus]|uniref:Uncharacterized protein n=1 Tax=Methanothermobacter thermautotrophicus TaxID=145262 RepID=A0A842YQX1_METTF|nr:hypothetical protein [Methanothermobacter thermautotrophicus]